MPRKAPAAPMTLAAVLRRYLISRALLLPAATIIATSHVTQAIDYILAHL